MYNPRIGRVEKTFKKFICRYITLDTIDFSFKITM